MPPRFTYWTILLEGKPTAFRAHTREELLPTLRQLQIRHPDAVMLWFARGRLWQSPEEERIAAQARRSAQRDRRGPAWRPGGEHRDPRERFKVPRDEKRRRFAAQARRDREDGGKQEPRSGDRPWPRGNKPRSGDERSRPGGDKPWSGGSKGRPGLGRPRPEEGGAAPGRPREEPRPTGGTRKPDRFRPGRPDGQRAENSSWRPRGPRGTGTGGRGDRGPGGGGRGRPGGGGNRGGGRGGGRGSGGGGGGGRGGGGGGGRR